ncbi:MAG: nuclear transport factor 2 family protein [Nitriliruptorales bacterium]
MSSLKGNPEPSKEIWSHRDDITLANPFGGIARGWQVIDERLDHATSHYHDGRAIGFENFATYMAPDLACIVEIEQYETKVAGREEIVPVAVRVTSIFRREDSVWKLVHRHADPGVSPQTADSLVQQ